MDATEALTADQLRNLIASELDKPEADHFAVAKWAHELLDLDEGRVRFTVDATHVQRLGRELVAKQETALAELVKNAYDADASMVLIKIDPPGAHQAGSIEIDDDGNGMSKEEIRGGWMRLSTDSKVDRNRSPRYRRLRAGRKGIGRFAVDRLGRKLELVTRPFGQDKGYRITFDWERDFTRGRELGLITHTIQEFDKDPGERGTQLKIIGLRDAWSPASIRTAWKMVFQLQSPVTEQGLAGGEATIEPDPGFEVFIDSQDARGARVSLSLEEEFSKLAVAEIHGELSADGTATYSVNSSKLNEHDSQDVQRPDLVGLGPVTMRAYYLIYDSDVMPATSVKSATVLAKELGGMKLYRNGFRVSPYGDAGDDWLSLAHDTARRAILVPANNMNFIGRVHVSSEGNPGLEETASREGLLEGEAYAQLVSFIREGLFWGAKRVGSWRQRKVTAGQKDFTSTRPSLHSRVAQLAEKLRNARSQADADITIDEILLVTSEFEAKARGEREESLKYEAMLRVLASLGLSIAVFSHEVSGSTALLRAAINNLIDRLKPVDEPLRSQLLEVAKGATHGSQRISELGGYLGSLTTQSESRKLRTLVVSTVCETFERQFTGYTQGIGVDLLIPEISPQLRTCPMHRSEFDSVLFNFLSNSIKAIKRAQKPSPKILLTAKQEHRYILLRFQDTGDGIKDEYKDRIFDAFFTTSGHEDAEGEGSGTGLGLRIVSDIAMSYGGSVTLAKPDPDFTTAFELRIPHFDSAKHAL